MDIAQEIERSSWGFIAFLHDIEEREIAKCIATYRQIEPDDTRTDLELVPYAVNQLIRTRIRAALAS